MEKIIGGANDAPKPNLNVNLSEMPFVTCESCGGNVFEERMMLKQVSKFMTGSEQDSIVPLPVISCAKCSHVNELFKPRL